MKIITCAMHESKIFVGVDNVLVIDCTRKSASTEVGKILAPSWDMVMTYKNNPTEVAWLEYTDAYATQLYSMTFDMYRTLRIVCDNNLVDYKYIILTCYCDDCKRCHRRLAAEHLAGDLLINNAEYLGEWRHISDSYKIELRAQRKQFGLSTKPIVFYQDKFKALGVESPKIKVHEGNFTLNDAISFTNNSDGLLIVRPEDNEIEWLGKIHIGKLLIKELVYVDVSSS